MASVEGFPSTHWSSVLAATANSDEDRCQALGRFLERYHRPLVAYLVIKFGNSRESAAEIFHEFVLQAIIQRKLLSKARPRNGFQFRSFLLCALHAFAVSKYRREQAQKRRPPLGVSSLEELDREELERISQPSPRVFDVEWAKTILHEALRRMKQECASEDCQAIWGVFESRLLKPILDDAGMLSYDELIALYKFASPSQAHNALVTAKRMFIRNLRQVISEYVDDEDAIDLELRELQLVLSHAS